MVLCWRWHGTNTQKPYLALYMCSVTTVILEAGKLMKLTSCLMRPEQRQLASGCVTIILYYCTLSPDFMNPFQPLPLICLEQQVCSA